MSKQKSVQFKKSALMGCQIIFQYFETFYRAYHHIETFYCDDTRMIIKQSKIKNQCPKIQGELDTFFILS